MGRTVLKAFWKTVSYIIILKMKFSLSWNWLTDDSFSVDLVSSTFLDPFAYVGLCNLYKGKEVDIIPILHQDEPKVHIVKSTYLRLQIMEIGKRTWIQLYYH